MGRSKSFILLLSSLMLVACQREDRPFEQALKTQCHSKQELKQNQETLREIEQEYCTQILSNLAPKAPEGVKPQWSRPNPYPALPDYFLYPDTNPMQINGKRLQSIATCMHKRCLNLTLDPQYYCAAKKCQQNKGAFILNTFIKLTQTCTAEPYTQRRVVHNIRQIFKAQTGTDLQWCSEAPTQTTRDLRIAFSQKVDACLPGAEQCPNEYRCVQEEFGYRCRPLKPLAAPEIPGINFRPHISPQPEGSKCELSKDCQDGLVCGHALGAFGICSSPCSKEQPCANSFQCYQEQEKVSFCNPTCSPGRSTADASPALCISAGKSGRWIQIASETLEQSAQKNKIQFTNLNQMDNLEINKIIKTIDSRLTCGNGVLEAPETCDRGKENGKVQRGSWCTQNCTIAECGNSILEPGEACECTLEYQDAFSAHEEIRKLYQLPTTCPGRHAISDGSEKALGFSCHSCTVIHARHMRETRQNPYFLPEFDPFNPPQPAAQSRP